MKQNSDDFIRKHFSDLDGRAYSKDFPIYTDFLDLNEQSILNALEDGSFYASKGPVIEDFYVDDNKKVFVKCSPARKIVFRINGSGNGNVVLAKDSNDIVTAEWDMSRKKPKWVRCEVIDENGNTAWTNPIFL